ncbi:MAG: patatin [bacterium]|nr:patatin [bacterium]
MTVSSDKRSTPCLGLALGSGAARGWAHIGVIDAMRELGIPIDLVTGASFGSLVAASLAADALEEMREFGLHLDWRSVIRFIDPVYPRSGLIDGRKLEVLIRDELGAKRIEDLSLPFRAIATDLNTGDEVVFSEGDIYTALRASISVPGLFTPFSFKGRTLVDGGLVNPVPVSVAREMGAKVIIAVDINHYNVPEQSAKPLFPMPRRADAYQLQEKWRQNKLLIRLNEGLDRMNLPGLPELDVEKISWLKNWLDVQASPRIFEVLLTSLAIMEFRIGENRICSDKPDIIIRPRIGHIRFHEFNRAEEGIVAGYEAAMEILKPLIDEPGSILTG